MKITRRTKLLIVALVLCMTTMVGSTLAWFTDEVTSANNVIEAGTLKVKLYVSDDGTTWTEVKDDSAPIFNYSKWEPGYTTYKFFQVKNAGDLALKFQLNLKADSAITGKYKLADVIDVYTSGVYTDNVEFVPTRANLGTKVGTLSALMDDVDGAAYGMLEAGQSTSMCIALKMQESAGNEYQGLSVGTGFAMQLLATQAMVETDAFGTADYDAAASYGVDNWNGGVVTNLPTVEENGEQYILITTAEELAGLAANVNSGAESYKDKTIKLGNNIDLANRDWTPIGTVSHNHDNQTWAPGKSFQGTFDGQGYTIANLTINDAELDGAGLFGYTNGATIKNLKIKNVNIHADCATAAFVGFGGKDSIAATTIANCHVSGKIEIVNEWAYVGGIFGYGNAKISDCSVIADGTGVITSKNRNAVGGISAWLLGLSTGVSNSNVKNIDLTGWANIGSITGYVSAGHTLDGNTAENITLTKTRIDGHPSIGLAAGGWTYNATKPITITNNTFKNITLNGTAVAKDSANYMYGSEFEGKDNSNFVLNNNTEDKIDNNLVYVNVRKIGTAADLSKLNADMEEEKAGKYIAVILTNDIDFSGYTWNTVDSHVDKQCFLSVLDGQGYTISNLTINGQAMFRRFAGSGNVTIKNVTFDNATVNSTAINSSILTVQSYQNVLLDNVDVKNSTITGGYKVAPLIGTVYNEDTSTITAVLKNCDVSNTTVKATTYDFCTTGMVAFVNAGDNDKIEFENCTVNNVKLIAPDDSYKAHAWVYTTGSGSLYNEAPGVVATNCSFEALK